MSDGDAVCCDYKLRGFADPSIVPTESLEPACGPLYRRGASARAALRDMQGFRLALRGFSGLNEPRYVNYGACSP